MYEFISDPGHGWLKVERKEVEELRVEGISGFSYQKGDYLYLEEDCDAPLFTKALFKKLGLDIERDFQAWFRENVKEIIEDNDSYIRRYPRYRPTVHYPKGL